MIAVLLCAGYATRMYPLTANFPKPLLPVGGTTVLDRLVEQIARMKGIEALHVVANAKFICEFERWRLSSLHAYRIVLHNDGSTANENRMGALADLKLALDTMPQPCRTLVAAGDNIFLFDLVALWSDFLRQDCHCVLGLHEPDVSKLRKTGVLEVADGGTVVRMHEKPRQPPSTLACPPLYMFQPSAGRRLDDYLADPAHNRDAPGWFIDYLSQCEQVSVLKPASGTRLDIGSIEDYRTADEMLDPAGLLPIR